MAQDKDEFACCFERSDYTETGEFLDKLSNCKFLKDCIKVLHRCCWLNPVFAPSKASVCDRSLAGVAGSNPAGGMDVCLL